MLDNKTFPLLNKEELLKVLLSRLSTLGFEPAMTWLKRLTPTIVPACAIRYPTGGSGAATGGKGGMTAAEGTLAHREPNEERSESQRNFPRGDFSKSACSTTAVSCLMSLTAGQSTACSVPNSPLL